MSVVFLCFDPNVAGSAKSNCDGCLNPQGLTRDKVGAVAPLFYSVNSGLIQ